MITNDQKTKHRFVGSLVGIFTLFFTVAVAYGVEQTTRNSVNPGKVVVDETTQTITQNIVREAIKKEGAEAAFAIVADPMTGKILAVANVSVKDPKTPHWVLSNAMEPASLMKGIVVAKAIDVGATTPDSENNCERGSYHYRGHVLHDWKKGGWEKLSTTETIALSSDICAMKIAEKLQSGHLEEMLTDFGFGENGSARSFPEASPGTLPKSANEISPWGMAAMIAYGTDFKTTPIEMLQAYGAIANGGNLLAPKLANDSSDPSIVHRVLSEDSARQMRGVLQAVVQHGTGSRAPSKLYTTAGKTASSWSEDVKQGDPVGGPIKSNFAQFIGFAPAQNPKIEVYVGVLNPNDPTGAHGSTHAAPVFTQIVDAVLQQWKVAPDKKI